jgi:hypothetical protein
MIGALSSIGTLVEWSANGTITDLGSTVVSSTELTAVIPASLVKTPGTARLWVANVDTTAIGEDDGFPGSNSVNFRDRSHRSNSDVSRATFADPAATGLRVK